MVNFEEEAKKVELELVGR